MFNCLWDCIQFFLCSAHTRIQSPIGQKILRLNFDIENWKKDSLLSKSQRPLKKPHENLKRSNLYGFLAFNLEFIRLILYSMYGVTIFGYFWPPPPSTVHVVYECPLNITKIKNVYNSETPYQLINLFNSFSLYWYVFYL